MSEVPVPSHINQWVRMVFTPLPGDGPPMEIIGKVVWFSSMGMARVGLLGSDGQRTLYPLGQCRIMEILPS